MLRWLGAEWLDREGNGSRKLLNHANEVSETLEFLPQREERADIGKDDVVEARKWLPNTPYIINTRARRCACIFIRLAAIKASNCIIVSLDSRRRFILADLSAKIPSAVGFMACRKTIDNKIKRAHACGYAKKERSYLTGSFSKCILAIRWKKELVSRLPNTRRFRPWFWGKGESLFIPSPLAFLSWTI